MCAFTSVKSFSNRSMRVPRAADWAVLVVVLAGGCAPVTARVDTSPVPPIASFVTGRSPAPTPSTTPLLRATPPPPTLPPATLPPAPGPPTPGRDAQLRCTERIALPDIEDVVVAKWSPDSAMLAVGAIRTLPSTRTPTGWEEELFLDTIDVLNGDRHGFGVGSYPEWSGSGRYLSYWTRDGEDLRVIQGQDVVAVVATATIPEVRWVGDTMLFFAGDEIRSWTGGTTGVIARVAKELAPHYPTDDIHFSADGERFSLTRYARDGTIERYIGATSTGSLAPLDARGATQTEWAPTGHALVVRYGDRLELRDDGGLRRIALPRAGTTHVWTADGRALLVGSVTPADPGGEAFDAFARSGAGATASAALPNLLGARTFSPNGDYFAGVSRLALDGTRLEVYRCGGRDGAPLASQAARWRAASAADPRRFVRPIAGQITQLESGDHTGVDIAAPLGSIVVAAGAGTVGEVGFVASGGQRVCVLHTALLESCYYHLAAALVTPGERVVRGQPIALVGLTGDTTGPHVHWETKVAGRVVDPLAQR